MSSWTTAWPTEPGWYWTWVDGEAAHQRKVQPTEVVIGGAARHTHFAYLRRYKTEQSHTVWWLPLDVPEAPSPPEGDS